MLPLFRLGQVLKGRAGTYTITKQIQDGVWFAKNIAAHETVVIKGIAGHPRVKNERDVLKRLQHRTPFLRPLVDEIEDPATPTTIALRHLDSDLWTENKGTLNRKELKHVCRSVLEALRVLHEENLVHTDVKLDNIFVNLQEDADDRFSEVQLGDLGSCYPADSKWATSGTVTGTPIWMSPEVHLEIPWNTASDIWQFGTMMISLIFGGNMQLFIPPDIDKDHEHYAPEIFKRQYQHFAPFPPKIQEIAHEAAMRSIVWVIQEVPPEKMVRFEWITEKQICKKDNVFISKMMKLDWRDRPTAAELLADEWWADED